MMEYNVYLISNAVRDVSKFVMTSCDILHGKVRLGDVRFWLMHIGTIDSWGSYDFDKELFQKEFTEKFLSESVPQVSCLHFDGCSDISVAADACVNIIWHHNGQCAMFFDLDVDISRILAVSECIKTRLEVSDRDYNNFIFCPYSQFCVEADMDAGVVSGEVGNDCIRHRLLTALGVV